MKWFKYIPVLLLVMALAACGTNANEDSTIENSTAVNGVEDSSSNAETDTSQEEVITEEAAYAGQIDSNSIEVNTESQTLALQIGEVKDVDWNSIEKDAPVVIEYYKNENGQHILTNIDVATVSKMKAIIEEGAYVGQIDMNSIEVNTEFKTLALNVGGVEGVDWSSIEKNAQVIIDYYENEKGQYILQSIKVK
ncbi:hypothetical protein ACOI1C_15430 [Bacillus sp. DJP31]|uniref:hypothetical protein n=1 Tax=Bacillus sp. DJP31 TaxID=3409789 RepID=UPI003BB5EA02